MPPSPEHLHDLLARLGASPALPLQRALGISQPTFSRLVTAATPRLPDLARFGHGRATLYALTRPGTAPARPVWRIDERGERIDLGHLHALVNGQWVFAPAGLGAPTVSEGLPGWALRLADALATQRSEAAPTGDEACLAWLAAHGDDLPGCLGVGEAAAQAAALAAGKPAPTRVDPAGAGLPATGMASPVGAGLPATPTGSVGERHSDLAVAAYLAAQVLRSARVPVAECQLVEVAGRFQLNTSRFDRVPPRGRRAWWPLDAAQPGLPARLADALPVLRRRGALGPGVAQSLAWLVAFAQCLGEDLDAGQVAVAPTGAAAQLPVPPWPGLPAPKPLDWRPPPQAQVACVTGVSPSHYAPLPDGTLPAHTLPAPAADVPRAARAAAERYWRTVAQDPRVSFNFRVIAAANGRVMEQRPARAAALAGETTA